MFRRIYETNNTKLCLYITIKCTGKKTFRAFAEDLGKTNSRYADRVIEVDGERTIYFSFPVMPKKLLLSVINTKEADDKTFTVDVMEAPLKTYNIWLDGETTDFLELALKFSQVSGFTNAPKLFQTEDKVFTIRYYPVIKDTMSGQVMNTPARIGHQTGVIDVSKIKFDTYTIPMRMMILLHEFSHKYKNPKINLAIENEVGADINALYIYLGMGFSKVDAIVVFAKVFLRAQNQPNVNRMRKIMEYIQKFENNEYAQLN